jgi:type II secretory pathway component GspD/PulD (secretin)
MLILAFALAKAQDVPPPPAGPGEAPVAVPDLNDLDIPPPPPALDELSGATEVVTNDAPVGAPTLPSEEELLGDVPPPPPPPEAGQPVEEEAVAVEAQIEEANGGFLIQDAAINDIFQMLAKRGGKQYFHNNMIAGQEYNVSGHLNSGDPLLQMEELAFQYGLTLYEKGATVYALTDAQLNKLPAAEWHYQLKYLRPSDIESIKALVQPMLTPGTGLVNFEPKTNTVVVIDTAHHVEMAKNLLMKIDQAKGQIIVEVKILSVNSTAAEMTGIDWSRSLGSSGVSSSVAASLNSLFGIGDGGSVSSSDGASGDIVLSPVQITGVLRALGSADLVKQISNPTLITEDNELATISLIDRVPIITSTTNNTTAGTSETEDVRYRIDEDDPVGTPETTREIGVTVAVTPTLLPDGTIRMKMRPRSAQIVDQIESPSGNVYPRVSESMIESIARIPDGCSLIVGGFYGEVSSKGGNKVPILGDIPGLNFFFKSKDSMKETASLVFVVTPTSYNPGSDAETCLTSKHLSGRLSVGNEHSWPDPANPGPAHLPDLERTLRGMRPETQRYQEPISSFQPDLGECCDETSGKSGLSSKSRIRKRR